MLNTIKDFAPAVVIGAASTTVGAGIEAITGLPVGVSITIILFMLGFMGYAFRFIVQQARWQQRVDDKLNRLEEKVSWAVDNTATLSENQIAAENQRNTNPNTRPRHSVVKIGRSGA